MPEVTVEQWKARQHSLNRFIDATGLKGVGHILVDGHLGASTRQRIKDVQFWCGYMRENIDGKWSDKFDRSLLHPNDPRPTSVGTVARGKARRTSHNLSWLAHHVTPGVTTWRGVAVCKCAVPILEWCAANGWDGTLLSGWRSIPYSIHLCFAMCGHPSCPGKCAGASTNHVGTTCARFAVDVTQYEKFRAVVARCPIKPRIWNNLPVDRVHFSPSGR